MKGSRVIVRGRVQGVFFRDTLRRRAESAGLAGWARNCADGSVEAEFEGDEAEVDRLVDFCRLGPPEAHVSEVEVHDEPPEGLTGFSVG